MGETFYDVMASSIVALYGDDGMNLWEVDVIPFSLASKNEKKKMFIVQGNTLYFQHYNMLFVVSVFPV